MPEKISADVAQALSQATIPFAKLLKEFPKNAADDFFYDESTLIKIETAHNALKDFAKLSAKNKSGPVRGIHGQIEKAVKSFSQLLAELPRSSADEFLYDRMIHNLVQEARGSVDSLNQIIP